MTFVNYFAFGGFILSFPQKSNLLRVGDENSIPALMEKWLNLFDVHSLIYKVKEPRAGFLSLGTTDILGRIVLCCEDLFCALLDVQQQP